MQWQGFLLRYLCLYGLLRWERKSHIVDCIWVSYRRADWCLDRRSVFCLKCRIMWGKKKNCCLPEALVWDSRYLDGSPVFSMAVSKSEDNLIQTGLRNKLIFGFSLLSSKSVGRSGGLENLAEHQHRWPDNWGSYKLRLWSRWNGGVTDVGLSKSRTEENHRVLLMLVSMSLLKVDPVTLLLMLYFWAAYIHWAVDKGEV